MEGTSTDNRVHMASSGNIVDIEAILDNNSIGSQNAADFIYLSESKLVDRIEPGNIGGVSDMIFNESGMQGCKILVKLVHKLHYKFCYLNNLDETHIWSPTDIRDIESRLHNISIPNTTDTTDTTNTTDSTPSIKLLSKSDYTTCLKEVYREVRGTCTLNTVGLNYIFRMLSHLPNTYNVPDCDLPNKDTYTYTQWIARYKFGIMAFEYYNRSKIQRESNGINSVTVVTAPGPFSCPMDCYYCPNQPGQPRSYLKTEPAIARANRNKFDPVYQLWDRCSVLLLNMGRTGKLEIIILGGTWSGYSEEYRTEFIRQLYFAANTFYAPKRRHEKADAKSGIYYPYVPHRQPMTLEEEITRNSRATNVVKIIGLSIETRPDWINEAEIRLLRRYNVTRVQMGIQHIKNHILKKINRGCTVEDAKKAMKLLLDNGFKVLVHYMPDLPGSTRDIDIDMFQTVFDKTNPDLQADEVKIYPTTVTPYTVIEKWHKEGKYQPMSEDDLSDVLLSVMQLIPPWVRADRIIRDIPTKGLDEHDQPMRYILGGLGGTERPDYRNVVQKRLSDNKDISWDIRMREPRANSLALQVLNRREETLVTRSYEASGGTELFISFESPNEHTYDNTKWIYGLCRLRLPDPTNTTAVFPILQPAKSVDGDILVNMGRGCAIIRQLKTHGIMESVNVGIYGNSSGNNMVDGNTSRHMGVNVQHRGLGKRLLGYAIIAARQHGYTRLAVIAGVGVRQYYSRLGFNYFDEESQMLVMNLNDNDATQKLEKCFREHQRQNNIETYQRFTNSTDVDGQNIIHNNFDNLPTVGIGMVGDIIGGMWNSNNDTRGCIMATCYIFWSMVAVICIILLIFVILK